MKRDAAIIAAAIAVILAIVLIRAGVFSKEPGPPAESISTGEDAGDGAILQRPDESSGSNGGILRRPGQRPGSAGVLEPPGETAGGDAAVQRPARR